FFFFQAEDGIRAFHVTGVQTCALPISRGTILPRSMDEQSDIDYMVVFSDGSATPQTYLNRLKTFVEKRYGSSEIYQSSPTIVLRSEERRVGKECRHGRSPRLEVRATVR